MMIPAGFLAKRVVRKLEWLSVPTIEGIYSVSPCISKDFCDYSQYWKHNGYWLFNDLPTLQQVAAQEALDLAFCTIFYYEVYDQEFDEESRLWEPFGPISAFETDVAVPHEKQLEGYDVVTFSMGTNPECSPLSCNYLAREIPVNPHCLLSSFEQARSHPKNGILPPDEGEGGDDGPD